MFPYERVNSTRKFTIVADIVSLLKKFYKRDAPFRAVFKVKTLAVLFSALSLRINETHTAKFKSATILALACFYGIPRARARLKHAHSFDRCGSLLFEPTIHLMLCGVHTSYLPTIFGNYSDHYVSANFACR